MPSENTEPTGVEQAEMPGIDSLAEILNATEPAGNSSESSQRGGSDDDSEASGSEDAALTKFNDLAGRLDIELDALYGLEVSQADDGTPVTIETLKDHYAKHGDLSLREIEFEERKTQQESSLMQAQEELRELMAAMPEGAIKPEVLQKIRAKHEAQVTLEKQRTLDVIPEWKDETRRTKEIAGMVEHLQQYGYPVDHLSHVADHRQLKYIRDNWQREQRIRAALEKVRAGKPAPTTPQKPAKSAPKKSPLTGVERGQHANKLQAIFSTVD